jgi:hypothetical protein
MRRKHRQKIGPFFVSLAPTPVLWIGSPSFHVLLDITKLVTAGESARTALSDAIEQEHELKETQSDI